MIHTGLCSITFRNLSVDRVIALARSAGLEGIEWGGDVHVPPGDPELASVVGEKTRGAGLLVSSYGSYYRCDREAGDFYPVANTAAALGTKVVRVWAGTRGSEEADDAYRAEVADCLREAVGIAESLGLIVSLEYHGGTLTDTMESTHQLLGAVARPELRLYWQPRSHGTKEENLKELWAALPYLSHLHLFHWGPGGWRDRRSLDEGQAVWRQYLEAVQSIGGERFALFEFVKDDREDQLIADAVTLKDLLGTLSDPDNGLGLS